MVADLIGAFDDYKVAVEGAEVPLLTEQSALTMFADYRVPQILRHRGILAYSEPLAQAIDSETELAYSSEFEVELRAATVITVDDIMSRVRESGSAQLKAQVTCAFHIDWILW